VAIVIIFFMSDLSRPGIPGRYPERA